MPGPTTEVLNEDIKELKGEIKDIRLDMATMRADVHAIAVGLAEFKGEVRVFMRLATWGGALLMTTVLTSGAAGIWWASGLTGKVDQLGGALAKVETRLSSVETRLTSIEAKATPPPPPPSKLIEPARP